MEIIAILFLIGTNGIGWICALFYCLRFHNLKNTKKKAK